MRKVIGLIGVLAGAAFLVLAVIFWSGIELIGPRCLLASIGCLAVGGSFLVQPRKRFAGADEGQNDPGRNL
jgi:hypothetical protein